MLVLVRVHVCQYLHKCLFRYKCAFVCVHEHVGMCPVLCMKLYVCSCPCGHLYGSTSRLVWIHHMCDAQGP